MLTFFVTFRQQDLSLRQLSPFQIEYPPAAYNLLMLGAEHIRLAQGNFACWDFGGFK
mgnify:CR=1 FL=1